MAKRNWIVLLNIFLFYRECSSIAYRAEMPYRCSVENCKEDNSSRTLYRLPFDNPERQRWMHALPATSSSSPTNIRICDKHWPENAVLKKTKGGKLRPTAPPSVFNFPKSCIPTPMPPPRPSKVEFVAQKFFDKKDKFDSFNSFSPQKDLRKKYSNFIYERSGEKHIFVFLKADLSESWLVITVLNKSVLTSPVTFHAFKHGIEVAVPKSILNPNNGFNRYSQFFEAVNFAMQSQLPAKAVLSKLSAEVQQAKEIEPIDDARNIKLTFLSRQLELLSNRKYSMADYCFAVGNYPRVKYEHLREFLVLPCPTTIHSLVSLTDRDLVLKEVFKKVSPPQKLSILIIDEVKIKPSVSFSGGILNGTAVNDPDSRASSILGVMLKCLHGGPSVMISVTPVHKMSASFQFQTVKSIAQVVESCGGQVVGSITDNHKVNQSYCNQFVRNQSFEAIHPLDQTRVWFLLFDSVHLLKCIRNNWISEKSKTLTFDDKTYGKFSDVQELYESEKDSFLKTTTLNYSSVYPSRLQLQNVKHVMNVFSDKVVSSLRMQGKHETAEFMNQVLTWWKVMNVCGKNEDLRFNDPVRKEQTVTSNNLELFQQLFTNSKSGHGSSRFNCLTHDTKKALVQTMGGMMALCKYLFLKGFQYVLLREIQSDRIEAEFACYRRSKGCNLFMTAGDVLASYKRRLTKFSSEVLEDIEFSQSERVHSCKGVSFSLGQSIENAHGSLSDFEEYSVTYIAGWLEFKCSGLNFDEEECKVDAKAKEFIEDLSRGKLQIPHVCTYEFVRSSLCFLKQSRKDICCRNQLITVLEIMNNFFDFGNFTVQFYQRLANVLLKGIHRLEKDLDSNSVIYQTAVKKARHL